MATKKNNQPLAEHLPYRHQQLLDASDVMAAQPWMSFECHQLSAGHFSGSIQSADIGGLQLANEADGQTVHKFGITSDDTCTVSVALPASPRAGFNHNALLPFGLCTQASPYGCFDQLNLTEETAVVLLPAATEFDIVVPGNIETWYVTFNQTELLTRARLLNERQWDRDPDAVMQFNTQGQALFTHSLVSALQLIKQAGNTGLDEKTLRKSLMDNVLLSMNQSGSPGETPSPRTRLQAARIIRKAREYTEASLAQAACPTIVDICGHVGVSERTLQYSFRKMMHMTPVAYLRVMRLNRARAALLSNQPGNTTVTLVATHWGFLHMGRFARDYQALFHEKPSETLARMR